MDIIQLTYLLSIVKCNYNLSEAAKQIHVTQSALSQFILSFEEKEGYDLFVRHNNRLVGLTKSGEIIYKYAQEIIQKHDEMMFKARSVVSQNKTTIRIGVPKVISMVYLTSLIPKIMSSFPNIQVEIVNGSSKIIKNLLTANEIDIAIIMEPTYLDKLIYQQTIIYHSECMAYFSKNHTFSHRKKLKWADILKNEIITFDEDFTLNSLINDKIMLFDNNRIIDYTSNDWNAIIADVAQSNKIGILPERLERFTRQDTVNTCKIVDTIKLPICACRIHKKTYSLEEEYVYKQIINIFSLYKS